MDECGAFEGVGRMVGWRVRVGDAAFLMDTEPFHASLTSAMETH